MLTHLPTTLAAAGPLGGPELSIVTFLVLAGLVSQVSRNRMVTLVVKHWAVSNQPGTDGLFVNIVGRREGIIAWVLSLLGVDATTTITVNASRIEFEQASLSGRMKRLIPLSSVCSTTYGYAKPWMKALVILVLIVIVTGVAGTLATGAPAGIGTYLIGLILGLGGAVIYYHLNKLFTLGFIEDSGVLSAIQFKKSVIENQSVDETQASYVSQLVQALIENARNRQPNEPA